MLRGISLQARRGECHLIAGPNGAGKTTLLRLLAGLARPTAGGVTLDGATPGGHPGVRRRIGLLSHQSQLYDDLTAEENLAFAGRLYGVHDPEGAAREQLAAVGLSARGREPVRRLSRGLMQRVAIARALLHAPDLLLLDEPFTGLDPDGRQRIAEIFGAQRESGRALILVSHDVHDAWSLATHAHVLVGGRWAHSGPAEGDIEGFLRRYQEVARG